jgi:hypothetical protein
MRPTLGGGSGCGGARCGREQIEWREKGRGKEGERERGGKRRRESWVATGGTNAKKN